MKLKDQQLMDKWHKINMKKSYQLDVIETIYNNENYLLWNCYDEIFKDESGIFDDMVLILDIFDEKNIKCIKRMILKDTEENRQYFMNIINRNFINSFEE
jgi:hypothetical protein